MRLLHFRALVLCLFTFFLNTFLFAQNVVVFNKYYNILYTRTGNDINIFIKEHNYKLISVESNDLRIEHVSGTEYILFGEKTGKALMLITVKKKHKIKKIEYYFDVKDFPSPFISIGKYKSGDSLNIAEFINNHCLDIKLLFDIQLSQYIKNYKILYFRKDSSASQPLRFEINRQCFTPEFLSFVQSTAKAGDYLLIYDIIASVSYTPIVCNPIQIFIK